MVALRIPCPAQLGNDCASCGAWHIRPRVHSQPSDENESVLVMYCPTVADNLQSISGIPKEMNTIQNYSTIFRPFRLATRNLLHDRANDKRLRQSASESESDISILSYGFAFPF